MSKPAAFAPENTEIASEDANGRDDAAWLLLGLTLAVMAPLQWIDPFRWSLHGLLPTAGSTILLGALAHFYHRHRPDPGIFAMLSCLQLMLLFTAMGASLSYMMAAHAGVFWDSRFASWDKVLGLDWMGWLNWVNAHPHFAVALNLAYRSLIPQMIALILTLGLCYRLAALRMAIQAAMMSGFIIIIMSAFMPALAAFVHFGINPADYPNLHPAAAFVHVTDVAGLRDGSLRLMDLGRMEGIITFPSYHGALAVIFCWGFSQATHFAARYAGMAVAILTLIATPVDGAHYFTDVLAGAMVAGICLRLARWTIYLDLKFPHFQLRGRALLPA